ncbi:claudin-4-like [Denticeps clupeoides]|uniref:claudin-4-like n=1 Tax=Denticeps clupeoides TaxID=299321 RepID=UPI0010A4F9B6|nr:claudin-4-like [Denticeps clupeoides]
MVSQGVQIVGFAAAVLGLVGVMVACGLPQWRVSTFIGVNIVTAQIYWEGIWMSCVVQSTGQMQCNIYETVLSLTTDLQAARAMIVVSIVTGNIGTMLSVMGGKCTNCMTDSSFKAKVCIIAGVLFILSGVLCLIPISWTANVVVQSFYNPILYEGQQWELGASLYIGWASSVLLLLGGTLLCLNCPPREDDRYRANTRFNLIKTTASSREYV